MTLNLHIRFPENLVVTKLLEQERIPCLCRVQGGRLFELVFQDPLPEVVGYVEGWDRKMIDDRAPAGAGGIYTHYCFGMVTLKRLDVDVYRLVDLLFFKSDQGWCSIVEGGELGEPMQWHSQQEIDEVESMFKARKANKKRQRLLDLLAKNGNGSQSN